MRLEVEMKRNIGARDQIIRGAAGLVILLVGTILGSYWGWLGFLLLASSAAAWSPLYRLIGFSSYQPTHTDTTHAVGA